VSKDQPQDPAEEFFPSRKSSKDFRDAAADCKACDLWKRGTQTVFGEGSRRAEVFFVGEQPGNEEDLSGQPFVGPAGRLLNEALADAGIDRKQTYVTNIEAFQMGTPWQTTNSQKAKLQRDRCLPSLA
jgi:uracil-DNA glycosylase